MFSFNLSYWWPVTTVAGRLDPITTLAIKQRRLLKGHQGKVLCTAWCQDKRHLVSSSQVGSHGGIWCHHHRSATMVASGVISGGQPWWHLVSSSQVGDHGGFWCHRHKWASMVALCVIITGRQPHGGIWYLSI